MGGRGSRREEGVGEEERILIKDLVGLVLSSSNSKRLLIIHSVLLINVYWLMLTPSLAQLPATLNPEPCTLNPKP